MSGHAVLAPSHAETWANCQGSPALCAKEKLTGSGSVYADEGTAAHSVASARLLNEPADSAEGILRSFYKTEDDFKTASEYVDVYVNAIRNAAEGKILLVEQRLPVERWTTEVGGKGTSDAIIIDLPKKEIGVDDLKFGQGNVVYAQDNKQMMLYALGALEIVEMLYGPMETIKMTIHQPRRDHISSHTITRAELMAFGAECQKAGAVALSLLKAVQEGRPAAIETYLKPSDEACLWCPAKKANKCPALTKLVRDTVFAEFTTVDNGETSAVTRTVESDLDIPSDSTLTLIDDWAKAKREYIDGRLRAGVAMKGWKLVLGKKGNRKFTDLAKIEELLKSLKFKKAQIYEEKLLPLTKLEKLVPKPKWVVFEQYISQSDPMPTAVSEKDGRPEYQVKIDAGSFENVEDQFNAFI